MTTAIERLLANVNYAADKHKYQRRKGDNSSYICHPLRVAMILMDAGLTPELYENTITAALFHDIIEDTGTSEAEMRKDYGSGITDIVMEVTDDKSLSKVERKKKQVENAPKKSCAATLVKLADKIDNLRSFQRDGFPDGWSVARVVGYHRWCYEVVKNLPEYLGYVEADTISLLREQCIKLCEPYKDMSLEEYYELLESEAKGETD